MKKSKKPKKSVKEQIVKDLLVLNTFKMPARFKEIDLFTMGHTDKLIVYNLYCVLESYLSKTERKVLDKKIRSIKP